jgi:hypothetical protein
VLTRLEEVMGQLERVGARFAAIGSNVEKSKGYMTLYRWTLGALHMHDIVMMNSVTQNLLVIKCHFNIDNRIYM